MRSLPQVREVGGVSALPFLDTSGGIAGPVVIEGRATPPAGEEPVAVITAATPGYFAAMRIPVMEGRTFSNDDTADRPGVAVVSATFAGKHWPDRSPIGQRIRIPREGVPLIAEIVGVVGDVRHEGLDRPAVQEVFLPHAQYSSAEITFVARTIGDPTLSLSALKAQIYAVAPNQAVYRTVTLDQLVADTVRDRRFMLALILGLATLALALAASGVYGVMSLVTTQRTREFGVRLTLGARRVDIMHMVMRQGAAIALAGTAFGIAGAFVAGRLLRRFLYGVGPNDVWTLLGVCATHAVVAAIACALPAIRATRVNPLIAMRTE